MVGFDAGLLGGAVQSLLRETWDTIPRSVAERFGAAINGGMADLELVSLGRTYKQLQVSFRQSRGDSIIEMMSSLAKLDEAVHSSEQPAEPANGESENAHRHLCINCGMPYGHEPWQCEPPDDQYCPMCAEKVAGRIPIWIERWTEPGEVERAVAEPAERKSTVAAAVTTPASGAVAITAVAEAASPAKPESAPAPVERECRDNRSRQPYSEPHQAWACKGGWHGRTKGVAL